MQCWPRVFKRSQHVGQCCVKLIPQGEYRIDIYQEAPATPCAAMVTGYSVRKRKSDNVARTFANRANERNMLRHASLIREQKKCWPSWIKSLTVFKLHATCANIMQERSPHGAPNSAELCCANVLRLFSRPFSRRTD